MATTAITAAGGKGNPSSSKTGNGIGDNRDDRDNSPPAAMPAVARILSRFDRPALESFLAVALDLLDVLDAPGDPDEPAFAVPCSDGQPGDPCDTELAGDDADISWPEWQTRGRRKLTAGGYEMPGASSLAANEDAEDDDPDHGLDEGEPDFARYRGEGPGCPISDPGEADDGL